MNCGTRVFSLLLCVAFAGALASAQVTFTQTAINSGHQQRLHPWEILTMTASSISSRSMPAACLSTKDWEVESTQTQ
jgi:hypothetical protein